MQKTPHNEPHVNRDDLAAFVEQRLDFADSRRVRRHLVKCKNCFEVYHDAVRITGARLADRTCVAVDEEWVREAMDLASPDAPGAIRRRSVREWWMPFRIWRVRLVSVAIVLIAAVFAYQTWNPEVVTDPFDPLSPAVYPISQAMVEASSQRALVFPGVEIDPGQSGSVLRSGTVKPGPSFDEAMSTLVEGYRSGSPSARGVHWIIGGYLATGQYSHARSFVEDAGSEFTEDADFAVLEAMLLYGENDLDGAARKLRLAIALEPDHWGARLNLAYILIQQDRIEESADYLKTIVEQAPDVSLVDRAVLLLESLETEQAPASNG
jgi:predicted negative regulator of RcsB-dependent stress response